MRNSAHHGYIGNRPNREVLLTTEEYLKDSPDFLLNSSGSSKLFEDLMKAVSDAPVFADVPGAQDLNTFYHTMERMYLGAAGETIANVPASLAGPYFFMGAFTSSKNNYVQVIWNSTAQIHMRTASINWVNPNSPVVAWRPWFSSVSPDELPTTSEVVASLALDYNSSTGTLSLLDENDPDSPTILDTVNLPLDQFLKSVSFVVDPVITPPNASEGTYLKFVFQTTEGESTTFINVSQLEESLEITNLEEQIYLDLKTKSVTNWEISAQGTSQDTWFKLFDVADADVSAGELAHQAFLEITASTNVTFETGQAAFLQPTKSIKLLFKGFTDASAADATFTSGILHYQSYVLEGSSDSDTRIQAYENTNGTFSVYALAKYNSAFTSPNAFFFGGRVIGDGLTVNEEPVALTVNPGTSASLVFDSSLVTPTLHVSHGSGSSSDQYIQVNLSEDSTAVTQNITDNSTSIATTEYVNNYFQAADFYEMPLHFNLDVSDEPIRTNLPTGYTKAVVVYNATESGSTAALAMNLTYTTGTSVNLGSTETNISSYAGKGVTFTVTITGTAAMADFRIKFSK
jgi:hypothetical protein